MRAIQAALLTSMLTATALCGSIAPSHAGAASPAAFAPALTAGDTSSIQQVWGRGWGGYGWRGGGWRGGYGWRRGGYGWGGGGYGWGGGYGGGYGYGGGGRWCYWHPGACRY